MDFIVKDSEGKEFGPLSRETLVKWTEAGKVRHGTLVRNTMLKSWKAAEDLEFLSEALKNQPEPGKETDSDFVPESFTAAPAAAAVKKTAFEYLHIPDPATVSLRLLASLFDIVLLLGIGLFMYCFFALPEIEKSTIKSDEDTVSAKMQFKSESPAADNPASEAVSEKPSEIKDNLEAETAPSAADDVSKSYWAGSRWTDVQSGKSYVCLSAEKSKARWIDVLDINKVLFRYFVYLLLIAVVYYGISLGTFAQSFGMWFWGIFIVGDDKELSEVLHFRAFVFSVLMPLLGIVSIPFVKLLPSGRGIHDMICGVRIIRTAGKKRA